jgi:hypothetical protein
MACRATLKVDEVIDEAQEKFEKIKYAHENSSILAHRAENNTLDSVKEYTERDYKKDMTLAYVQTGAAFTRLYGPAVVLGVASIGCILGAHSIMRRRNIALMAAYKIIDQSFKDYRKRVIEEFGEDKDRQFKYGIREIETTEMPYTDEEGVKHKTKKTTVEVVDPNKVASPYARLFNEETSTEWSKTPDYNMVFLKCQQNTANDLLHSRGHLFLNEVYDMLGLSRSQGGVLTGWVMGVGDDYVDFNLPDVNSKGGRDFVNGYYDGILLDFNVDGVIYDLI